MSLTGDGEPEEVTVQLANTELFRVLGVNPIIGRTLTDTDAQQGAPTVAVLSHGLWQRRFGGSNQAVGNLRFFARVYEKLNKARRYVVISRLYLYSSASETELPTPGRLKRS